MQLMIGLSGRRLIATGLLILMHPLVVAQTAAVGKASR
jgi:hypothetical protein